MCGGGGVCVCLCSTAVCARERLAEENVREKVKFGVELFCYIYMYDIVERQLCSVYQSPVTQET